MTIKQSEIIKAYNAASAISETVKLKDMDLWRLFNLRKTLLPYFEFQQEREDAIRGKYAPLADENGMITGDTYKAFLDDMKEAGDFEQEIDVVRFKITTAEGMTVPQMEALDPFVEFTEPAE